MRQYSGYEALNIHATSSLKLAETICIETQITLLLTRHLFIIENLWADGSLHKFALNISFQILLLIERITLLPLNYTL